MIAFGVAVNLCCDWQNGLLLKNEKELDMSLESKRNAGVRTGLTTLVGRYHLRYRSPRRPARAHQRQTDSFAGKDRQT